MEPFFKFSLWSWVMTSIVRMSTSYFSLISHQYMLHLQFLAAPSGRHSMDHFSSISWSLSRIMTLTRAIFRFFNNYSCILNLFHPFEHLQFSLWPWIMTVKLPRSVSHIYLNFLSPFSYFHHRRVARSSLFCSWTYLRTRYASDLEPFMLASHFSPWDSIRVLCSGRKKINHLHSIPNIPELYEMMRK